MKSSRKSNKKIVSGRAPVLNCAHRCFQDPSGALQRPPGEFPEAFSSVFLHILARFYANLCSRTHVVCNLSQQPARSLLESSLKPSAVPFCTSSRAFMRICARQRTSCAHSLSNLLAVLIPEKFCNPSRALMRIYAR